jgi:hypothetical protein
MIADHFPTHPERAPQKRFRGQKRYYRRVFHEAQQFSLSLEEEDWYDLWHYHADWPGYGNLSWRQRRSHIEALCCVFLNIAQQAQTCSKPYQLWMYFDLQEAGQDAVYFHTPNPNSSNFPVRLTGVTWGFSAIESFLSDMLSSLPLRAAVGTGKNAGHFSVYSPARGHSLE